MARNRKISRIISKLTGELAVTTLDLVVLAAAFGGGFFFYGPRGKDLYAGYKNRKALEAVSRYFYQWNRSKFRRAVGRAAGDGLIMKHIYGFELTESGHKRLKNLLPSYKQPRPWDGKLWLVTYDIPEDKRHTRDRFRDLLEKIGCRHLQESVLVSLKDPKPWISASIPEMKKGSVIVSCLGKDGSIGAETLPDLVSRIFELKNLSRGYRHWIDSVENQPGSESDPIELGLRYLSLLRHDPMVPKELLPHGWPGDQARKLFEEKIESKMGDINRYL